MRNSWTRTAAGVAVAITVLAFPVPGGAEAVDAPASFAGAAEAMGVRGTWTLTPATLTDTPFDGGGPTAQVSVDSLGSSSGDAAFPDPGQAYVTIPGTVTGVLAGGAGPIPPTETPTLPNYPFFVSSDAGTTPQGQAGAGPYELETQSEPGTSTAVARTGFVTGLVGNVARIASSASLAPQPDGTVLAEAVSHVEGLTVGPLTIGEISSTARMEADGTGTAVPSTEFHIYGVRVGGFPVEVKHDAVDLGGANVPLPLTAGISEALKPSGITVELLAARKTETSVLAPALQITVPYESPTVEKQGGYKGAVRLIIGSATATLTATAASPTDLTSDDDTTVIAREATGVPGGPAPAMSPLPTTAGLSPAPPLLTSFLPDETLATARPPVGHDTVEPPAFAAAVGPVACVW
jgi:hypothetical protein